jgi:hypothetical protein
VFFGIPEWAIGVGFIILAGSLARVLTGRRSPADRFRGSAGRDLGPVLDELQRRLGEVEAGQRRLGEGDDVQGRLSEVEERLDFVERVLAKQREAERTVPPRS